MSFKLLFSSSFSDLPFFDFLDFYDLLEALDLSFDIFEMFDTLDLRLLIDLIDSLDFPNKSGSFLKNALSSLIYNFFYS